MKKSITPQEQDRLDQARQDMIGYWQQTPIIDRTTSAPIEPAKPKPVQRVYLNDLAGFMVAHPTARITGRVNGDTWPVIALDDKLQS